MSALTPFESELKRAECEDFADALRRAGFDKVCRLKTITMNDLDDIGVPRLRRQSIVLKLTGKDPRKQTEVP